MTVKQQEVALRSFREILDSGRRLAVTKGALSSLLESSGDDSVLQTLFQSMNPDHFWEPSVGHGEIERILAVSITRMCSRVTRARAHAHIILVFLRRTIVWCTSATSWTAHTWGA